MISADIVPFEIAADEDAVAGFLLVVLYIVGVEAYMVMMMMKPAVFAA